MKILKGLEAAVDVVKAFLKQYDSDSYKYVLKYHVFKRDSSVRWLFVSFHHISKVDEGSKIFLVWVNYLPSY